jgi:serine/threonine protein kinase
MLHVETDEMFTLEIPRYIDNYVIGHILGKGITSAVLSATDRRTGKEYALKVMSSSNLTDHRLLSKINRELAIVQTLNHKNIVRFYDVIVQEDLIVIVSERCEGGELFEYISENRIRDQRMLKRLFWQIALAVQYLHEQGIAHSDIKPENILLDAEGNAKLIDFGFVKREEIVGDDEKNGSLIYAAPELLMPGRYRPQKADIWSLGILLYVMTTRAIPYPDNDDSETIKCIKKGQMLFNSRMDADTERLVRTLTRTDPSERPTIDKVLVDPFFDEVWLEESSKQLAKTITRTEQRIIAENDSEAVLC